MASSVNVHEAKTRFFKLLKQAQLGEEIIIAKAGNPVARLLPFAHIPVSAQGGEAIVARLFG